MKKVSKTLLRIMLALVCFALIICVGLFVWSKIHYHDFYKDAQRSFSIPGLSSGFIPQGFDYEENEKVYLISGYMKDHSQSSRIYAVHEDGSVTFSQLLDQDGNAYTGHCGGVAINGAFLYVSSEDELSVFALEDILNGIQAKQLGSVEIGERVSFCTFENGYLLTGAFYRAGSYETPAHHHVTTPAGDENPALIWIYKADASQPFGLCAEPVAAISVREQVQGVAITDEGKIVLSTSWGVGSSQLWLYEMDQRVGSINDVPLYYLDSANLVETVTAPPMSEEILWLDGRLYIMTESACTKYIFGNFIDGRHVFAYQF